MTTVPTDRAQAGTGIKEAGKRECGVFGPSVRFSDGHRGNKLVLPKSMDLRESGLAGRTEQSCKRSYILQCKYKYNVSYR